MTKSFDFPLDYSPAMIYVAAPYSRGVREARAVYEAIFERGHVSTSRWIPEATEYEDLLSMSEGARLLTAARNDADVLSSDGLVALCFPNEGREMFAEAALARLHEIPILWIAKDLKTLPLSAFREGSLQARSFEEGFPQLLSRCFPKNRK